MESNLQAFTNITTSRLPVFPTKTRSLTAFGLLLHSKMHPHFCPMPTASTLL